MPHHLDALDVVVRESTRLVSEQRQFRDGVRSAQVAPVALHLEASMAAPERFAAAFASCVERPRRETVPGHSRDA